jgi:hypothetical protein
MLGQMSATAGIIELIGRVEFSIYFANAARGPIQTCSWQTCG